MSATMPASDLTVGTVIYPDFGGGDTVTKVYRHPKHVWRVVAETTGGEYSFPEGTTVPVDARRCACARHDDGSTTTSVCAVHAGGDPCLTMAVVTGKRRKGTILRGTCTNCGWTGAR